MLAVEREAVITPWNWTNPLNDALWRDTVKTLSDPCPAGWRVPKIGGGNPWEAFYSSSKNLVSGTWDITSKGARWTAPAVYGGTAWYATSGLRGAPGGKLSDYGSRGLIWTSGWGPNTSYFNVQEAYTFLNTAVHAHGFPVRCVRE